MLAVDISRTKHNIGPEVAVKLFRDQSWDTFRTNHWTVLGPIVGKFTDKSWDSCRSNRATVPVPIVGHFHDQMLDISRTHCGPFQHQSYTSPRINQELTWTKQTTVTRESLSITSIYRPPSLCRLKVAANLPRQDTAKA